jgi:hypothetical protein
MHPPTRVSIVVDRRHLAVPAGITVAAALALAGGEAARRSVRGEFRAPLCGMGVCMECRVTVDGRAHQRGCQVVVRPGMVIQTAAGAPA